MTRAERELREREVTLYCTGRYGTRAEARTVARQQLAREHAKRQQANAKTPPALPDGVYNYTIVT